jgi:serine/threonine protein kinase
MFSINSIHIPIAVFPHSDSNKQFRIQNHMYTLQNVFHRGSHGALTLLECETCKKEFVWKTSFMAKRSLKNEAYLQEKAHEILSRHGFPWAVPKVKTVFNHPIHGVGFIMDHIPHAEVFANFIETQFLWGQPNSHNDRLLIEVVAQVCVYLSILEKELKLNHRDLKSTNVILVQRLGKSHPFFYKTNTHEFKIHTSLRTCLVDFGFACSGLEKTIVSAGEYLPTFDGCPKVGRDMFLFLTHLWNVKAVRESLTPRLHKWIESRLSTESTSWTKKIERLGEYALNAIYLFTTSEQFQMPFCSPEAVLNSLSVDFPETVMKFRVGV